MSAASHIASKSSTFSLVPLIASQEEEGFLHTVFTCLQYAVPHRAHMHIWCRRVRGYAAHDKLGTCSSVQVRSCNHTVAVALNTDRKQSCVYIARTFQAPLASVAAE